jgi:putative membrane protein
MSYLSTVLTISVAGAMLLVSGPMRAADSRDSRDQLSVPDRKFMLDAAKGGMMEVHMGHIAVDRGSSPGVKALGQRFIDDHTKAGDQLKGLASQKGVNLPADSPAMDPKGPSSKRGAAFDREFAKMAVADHVKDIAAFEKEANSGSDPDVKAWASSMLPTLHAHLDAAKALADATNK